MPANFNANTYSTKTGYVFATSTFTANLSYVSTSNTATNDFSHSAKTSAANSTAKVLNTTNRPIKGQLYPRLK